MQSKYLVYLGNDPAGNAVIAQQGLYYNIICSCNLQTNIMHNIWLLAGEREINLGICAPEGDALTLRKRIPAKQVGDGELKFILRPRYQAITEKFVPIHTDEPFAYLESLNSAVLEKREEIQGIIIRKNED